MTAGHTALPPPYHELLSADDTVRYRGVLPPRHAQVLDLRLAGHTYAQIGHQLGIPGTRARDLLWQACRIMLAAKQRAAAPPPADTP